MNVNGRTLLNYGPIKDMESKKLRYEGTSYGLSEAGYDITIAQTVYFFPPETSHFMLLMKSLFRSVLSPMGQIALDKALYGYIQIFNNMGIKEETVGRFVLASALEEFQMPNKLVATVKDKSTWARRGLSVFNTVAEPGWNGFLTLELVFHGHQPVKILRGQGIAQVLFTLLTDDGDYADGKYQNQEAEPVEART